MSTRIESHYYYIRIPFSTVGILSSYMDKGHGKYTVHDRNDAPCVMGTYPIRHTPDRQKLKLTDD